MPSPAACGSPGADGRAADSGSVRDGRARRREACIVSTRGSWSQEFLVWMAMMDAPMQVLEPPELIDVAKSLVTRLAAAAAA